ncbi:hypothetical protein ABID30_002206 [Enterococcus rotai]|uniref:Schlafen group 3-like DNA/RNA helicase domain-containing protein n=1 Tax=Enterococcus rotai TaxID=118060 RepID=A0A0U2LYP3_9ENTE|nr:DNA/RNA helicase domain-containing protein [Enterococcus rotai]ALS38485.1 hypothetical protein ATZ35_15430 [Enterococcus rotai]
MDLLTYAYFIKNNDEEKIKEFNRRMMIDLKLHEIKSVESLIDTLSLSYTEEWISWVTEGFLLSYKIPQIGEEFDLLKMGSNYHINIELKSDLDLDKMKKQLIRKMSYLSALDVESYCISFSSEQNRFFQLNQDFLLEEISVEKLAEIINKQEYEKLTLENIDAFFEPSNYLISPFNTVDKFINDEYFLTNHQEKIKKEILKKIEMDEYFFMLEGGAGTGKTLLLYDIIKNMSENELVLHVGNLNDGHLKLRNEYGFNIHPVYKLNENINENINIIFVDESQRIREKQLKQIVHYCTLNKVPCIFSLDKEQCLHNSEIEYDVKSKLESITNKGNKFKLTEKIRSNEELANFIKLFLKTPINQTKNLSKDDVNSCFETFLDLNIDFSSDDLANFIKTVNRIAKNYDGKISEKSFSKDFVKFINSLRQEINISVPNRYNNIEIKYFSNMDNAKKYVSFKSKNGFKPLTYATSQYGKEPLDRLVTDDETPHKVIGQEFENVIVILDKNFGYKPNSNGKYEVFTGTSNSYYHSVKMFFQNITRSRKKISIVIVDNMELFNIGTSILERF